MRPYIDFSDSKGPLLWLIYGLGYLIDNTSYVGVFWITCIFYFITFNFAYKLAKMYVDKRESFIVMSIVAFAYINTFHNQVRAEDFCHIFVMSCLYYMMKWLITGQYKTTSVCIGIAFGGCLLIKYNIAAMILVFPLIMLVKQISEKKYNEMATMIVITTVSSVAIVAPFAGYLAYRDCLKACIDEYFLTTYSTISLPYNEAIASIIKDVWSLAGIFSLHPTKHYLRLICLLYIIAIYYFCKRHKHTNYLPFIASIVFLFINSLHAFNYYFNIFSSWIIFLPIIYLNKAEDKNKKIIQIIHKDKKGPFIILLIITVLIPLKCIIHYHNEWGLSKSKRRNGFYKCEYVIQQIDHPTIVYNNFDVGMGILGNALPGCKYWAHQLSATDEMEQDRFADIERKKPDFIVVHDDEEVDTTRMNAIIRKFDYVKYGTYFFRGYHNLYGPKGLKTPMDTIIFTKWDIISKNTTPWDK
ncbi:MAG: glycosyltransferase family 39 protein [Bacteroidales bacterium]|nr:glycosyltransferase family 39 protein [Bacteroidales bacterium]